MSAITWTSGTPGVHAPSSRVRLTRRGRLVLSVLLLGLALAFLVVATAPATATSDRGRSEVAERVTVRPGETLWAIASRVRPEADPRATIARIRDMNGLDSSVAQAGQVLLVPAGG